jgi:hypothetical protein
VSTPVPSASSTATPGTTATATIVPTAEPDQIVFIGRVPAGPGTTITVRFLNGHTLESFECATTETTSIGEEGVSAFAVTIAAECAEGRQDPKFCWGGNLCYLYLRQAFGYIPLGSTIDLGLLTPGNVTSTDALPLPGTNDGVTGLPSTGSPPPSDTGRAVPIATALLCLGIAVAGLGLWRGGRNRGISRS